MLEELKNNLMPKDTYSPVDGREERVHMDSVNGTFESIFGTMKFSLSGKQERGDHVYIQREGYQPVTVNRVDYTFSIHLFYAHAGAPEQKWGTFDYHNMHMHRKDNYRYASDAAHRKLEKTIISEWAAFISVHPELLIQAEKVRINNEIVSTKEVEEKQIAILQECRDRIMRLEEMEKSYDA